MAWSWINVISKNEIKWPIQDNLVGQDIAVADTFLPFSHPGPSNKQQISELKVLLEDITYALHSEDQEDISMLTGIQKIVDTFNQNIVQGDSSYWKTFKSNQNPLYLKLRDKWIVFEAFDKLNTVSISQW